MYPILEVMFCLERSRPSENDLDLLMDLAFKNSSFGVPAPYEASPGARVTSRSVSVSGSGSCLLREFLREFLRFSFGTVSGVLGGGSGGCFTREPDLVIPAKSFDAMTSEGPQLLLPLESIFVLPSPPRPMPSLAT